jgi:hypothetical protein
LWSLNHIFKFDFSSLWYLQISIHLLQIILQVRFFVFPVTSQFSVRLQNIFVSLHWTGTPIHRKIRIKST